jgi:competence protein ComGC
MIKRNLGNRGFTIGELLVVFAIVAAMVVLMIPVINYVNARTDKVMCINNIRAVGLALYIYAREHDGKFPESVKTLYDEKYLADRRFTDCPASKHVGTPEDPDYVYTGGLDVRSPSKEILLRDKEENHSSGKKNVLYVNGLTKWE